MALCVNDELVPEELISEERRRWVGVPGWETIETAEERESLLQQASEKSAIERVLLRQEMRKDTRPIDPAILNQEMERIRLQNGCRPEMTANQRESVEVNLRLQRAIAALAGPEPAMDEGMIRALYDANRDKFRLPEMVRSAHILKRIDRLRPEAQAKAEMDAAIAELECGVPFAAVADRHSDCKGNGGDLGYYVRGKMLEAYDAAVFDFPIGKRTDVFRTTHGLHVAEVIDRKPERLAEYDEAREAAERALKGILAEEAVKRAMEKLVAGAKIEWRAGAEVVRS